MPIVDIEELEKKAAKKKEETREIVTKEIDGKTYFKGKFVDQWFDSYDDCLNANQAEANKAQLKKLGYNEAGQSPEQVRILEATAKLTKKRLEVLEELKKIDAEIAQIKRGKLNEVKEEVKSKKK